ncbi:hypothetical protein [Caminibacter sp.]
MKIRYIKGLSIIKILYEKVLSLDHHFSSITTLNEINKISNPNYYPDFSQINELIKSKVDKKHFFSLPSILKNNIYISTIDFFIKVANSSFSTKQKTKDLEKIKCILDFTLSMHKDLNTIYFETKFLQENNNKLKVGIERLFKNYTKPIKYYTPLEECRANDDWDTVKEKINTYFKTLEEAIQSNNEQKIFHMQVDISFPIKRLIQFILQYNDFIDQGDNFYKKFKIILNSYENKRQCNSKLPPEYEKLKQDIDITIMKFNTAYKTIEINGTQMKEILYGISEYE